MYNITNGIKERQDFLQLDGSAEHYLSASITTNTMLCGEALQQFRTLGFRARRKYNSPHYRIRAYMTHQYTGKELFNFETITSNVDKVYELTHLLHTKINTILWKKD